MWSGIVFVSLWVTACSPAAYTGQMMGEYAVKHAMPYVFETGDVDAACKMGVAFGPLLLSFGRVTQSPDRGAIATLVAAGMCAESEAWEAELDEIRAVRAGRGDEAKDARIREQRAHALAALRFVRAYHRYIKVFGEPGPTCGKVAPEDRVLALLGLTAGLLAVQHDRAAGGVVNVPLDIPRKVALGASCLPDDSLFGMPKALQAAVWATVPGSGPPGSPPPLEALRDASALGERQGVRLASALRVQVAALTGNAPELRAAIQAHAELVQNAPTSHPFLTLNKYATMLVQHESDKIWTQATGHRTPPGALGTFPEESKTSEGQRDDSLLDNLQSEEQP